MPKCVRPRPAVAGALGVLLLTRALGWGSAAAGETREEIRARALPSGAAGGSSNLFERLSSERTGLDFVYQWNTSPRYERLLNSSVVGGGVCAGDYDGDGLPDLCLTRPAGGPRLYHNLGDFRFTNVTSQAGLREEGVWSTGATFVDINNDGRLDLYLCCYDSPNRLYVNEGNGTFTEQARAFGLDFNGASLMMAFGDYDRDGRLDGYLLTGGLIPQPAQRFRVKFIDGRPVVPEELQEFWQLIYQPEDRAAMAEAGQFDHLFHNNGNGTFTDVSRPAGIRGCDFGNAVLWWDYNGDGWPDLYVANDYFGPDHLYRNNGNGTFTDVTAAALPHTPWTSMGADAADINNDGLPDLIASDMSGTTHYKRMLDLGDLERSGWFLDLPEPRQYQRNALYVNTGLDRFLEVAYLAGVANTDWTWSILFGDLDNDGREDLFVPNGMTRDWMDNDLALQAQALPPAEATRFWGSQPVRRDVNLAFRNLGDLQFENVAQAWGLNHPGPGFGAVLVDLDGDGRLDLVVNDFEAPARLYRNRGQTGGRLKLRLQGTQGNAWGVGAVVRLETAAGRQMRYLTLSHGFLSAQEPVLHFGLGASPRIDRLTVEWPGGRFQAFTNLPADQSYTVVEPSGPAAAPPRRTTAPTRFVRSRALAGARHAETPFDDFQRQPLLPYKLSQLGPGLAWGDADGDGRGDLYVTGTARQPGTLFLQEGPGRFRQDAQSGLGSGVAELGALFLDANNDGAMDLYVVTGGVAAEPGDESLRDRLYLNDGHGHFTLATNGMLPDLRDSGSAVVGADFDRDGDLDLFVGGRVIPGRYPLVPNSRLLRNEGGRFTDVTGAVAPGLGRAGLVNGALWSDVDDDGWIDLLVTCEWGPVRWFHNEQGRLIERSQEAGLAGRSGWWTGIAGADVDNDGDMDYVVGNLGRNSRYQLEPEQSVRLYYGDFARSGEPQILEAINTASGLLPLRGRSALERLIPQLRERFPTHRAFASATLPELFDPRSIAEAFTVEASCCESGLLLNDGQGRFRFLPLPRLAQAAPCFGVALTDVDGDGHADLCLAQNFYSPQRETGRMDGGVSLLLLGRGDGSFAPVWPDHSGLLVAGDARSLVTADLNGDGWTDLVVGVNDGELQAFENQGSTSNRVLQVTLRGTPGNPSAAGARVRVRLQDGSLRTAEIQAGGGYLAQAGSTLAFGLGATDAARALEIRWPDGRLTSHDLAPGELHARIREP
jgi:enediyne biosynthesis protein E4